MHMTGVNIIRRALDAFIMAHREWLKIQKIRNLYIALTHTWLFAGINAVNPKKAFQKTCELADKYFTKEEKEYISNAKNFVQDKSDLLIIDFANEMWAQLQGTNI